MRALILLLAVFVTGCTEPNTAPDPDPTWLKGNLHTHSFWSDGDDFPETIAQWYIDNGYDFLAISDHNTMAVDSARWVDVTPARQGAFDNYVRLFGDDWVETRPGADGGPMQVRLKTWAEYRRRLSPDILLIRAEEISDGFQGKPIHVNATNLQEYVHPAGREAEAAGTPMSSVVEVMQANVDRVLEQRERLGVAMMPHINHPNFMWAILAEELALLDGERFFEVYNGHPMVNNNGDSLRMGTERMWDVVNTIRLRDGRPLMLGLAVDDAHHYQEQALDRANTGRGWVMVHAPANEPEALIHAMERGDFYASTGVTASRVEASDTDYTVEIEPEEGVSYRIDFVGTRADHDPRANEIGIVLASHEGTQATYSFDGSEMYVRARVVSDKLKDNPFAVGEVEKAWTQPVRVERVK